MRTVSVRELKSETSALLRAVERGESIRITSRGRPVAELGPCRERTREQQYRELVVQGRVTPAQHDGPITWPAPKKVKLPEGSPTSTELIREDRDGGPA